MTVFNQLDRFHLAIKAIGRVPGPKDKAGGVIEMLKGKLAEHARYIRAYGEDMPEIRNSRWLD